MSRPWFVLAVLWLMVVAAADAPPPRSVAGPVLRDSMGLVVHTVLFRPELYRPVCRLVRNYHGLEWDIGRDTNYAPRFPFARNQVNWEELYGGWRESGYETLVCVVLDDFLAGEWHDLARDAYAYGLAFARFFGPSGTQRLVEAVQIGNEPGLMDDATYREIFEHMARGIRKGDPRLRIVTCAATAGPSHRYAKGLSTLEGLEDLYDAIAVHTYAHVENWPTWRRSYPEDPALTYLTDVQAVQEWRDVHAPGKEVWVTEFGWDASTKEALPTGEFSQWVGSTETEQAQYLVRSFLVFSAMGVERAYIFWFDDQDEPQVHGSSGLTRHYQPKPAFHAVAHLHRTLGEYRFARALVEDAGDLYLYEFRRGDDEGDRIWVAWSPTGSGREREVALPRPPGAVVRAERMPLAEGAVEPVQWESAADGGVRLVVNESPAYLWLRVPGPG